MGEFEKRIKQKKTDIIISAHHEEADWDMRQILEVFDEAKKEFPYTVRKGSYYYAIDNYREDYKAIRAWFLKWFGE